MTPSPEYTMAAYMLTIAEQMERDLLEHYVDGDTEAKKHLLCETVIYADREVSQAAFHKFLGLIRQVQKQAEQAMGEFEVRRRNELQINFKDKDDDGADEPDDNGEQEAAGQGPRRHGPHRGPRVKMQSSGGGSGP